MSPTRDVVGDRGCSVDGCDGVHDARGWCNKHYQQMWPSGQCRVDSCDNRARAQGLCNMHYQRQRKWGTVGPAETVLQSNVGLVCIVDECDNPATCKGFCRSHTSRFVSRGISYEYFKQLVADQDGRCAICGRDEQDLKIDHAHGHCAGINGCKDCIRGLLCSTCNTGLGKFGDDVFLLKRALDYLIERT